MRTSFKVKDKGQGHQADMILRLEMRHIFRTERPTNFKLGVMVWYASGACAVNCHAQL